MQTTAPADDFSLAPLRGVTVRAFRNLLAHWFTPPHRTYSPFIPTFAGDKVKPTLLRDIDPQLGQDIPLVPQVIGNDPTQLRALLRAFKSMGYYAANLNAGCPHPFIVRKRRGAGLMRDPDIFARMLETGCEEMPGGFSVKVRLGIDSADLLCERMALINNYPLSEVTIHARTARQMYGGNVDTAAFREAAALCRHPLVYNGDIFSRADYLRLKELFPEINRWMVGRAAAINPAIFGELLSETPPAYDPAHLQGFLEEYLEISIGELYGPASVLGRMKELWSYLHTSFEQGEWLWRNIRISRTLDEYRRAAREAFS